LLLVFVVLMVIILNHKKTNSALIPVAGRIIQTFSKNHQGLSFATNFAQAVRAVKTPTV
jgi:hypothetical protein